MPLYFAYGSNMSPPQMRVRCPGSQPVGAAELAGWRFSMTARGGANIVPDAGSSVHGVLWNCEPHHIAILDEYEGIARRSYLRQMTRVVRTNGREATAITYISFPRYPGRARVNYLLTAVLPGARAFDLPANYIAEIEGWLPRIQIGPKRSRYRGRRTRARLSDTPRKTAR